MIVPEEAGNKTGDCSRRWLPVLVLAVASSWEVRSADNASGQAPDRPLPAAHSDVPFRLPAGPEKGVVYEAQLEQQGPIIRSCKCGCFARV
jgi:hypothetical protein